MVIIESCFMYQCFHWLFSKWKYDCDDELEMPQMIVAVANSWTLFQYFTGRTNK